MFAYHKMRDSSAVCLATTFWYIAWTNYRKKLQKTSLVSINKQRRIKKYWS